MNRIMSFLTAGAVLLGLMSCQKEQEPEFGILSENEFTVDNAGGYVTVIMHTNVAYTVTPQANWCHVVVKQPICFKVQVDENATLEPRESIVTVETDGFEPIDIRIIQEKGRLFFRMDDAEKSKTFAAEPAAGEEKLSQTVVLETNMGDYNVAVPQEAQSWCSIGSRTKEGFEVICQPRGENDYGIRSTTLTLEMEGLEELEGVTVPVEIEVSQKGQNMIKNPVFADDKMDGWISVPEEIFALNDAKWIPGDLNGVGHDIEINSGKGTGFPAPEAPFTGHFLYHIENVPAGTYTFSFRSMRGSSTNFTMSIVLRNADNTADVFSKQIELQNNWGTNACEIEVETPGEYYVGIYVDFSASGPWFNLVDFKFE